MRGGGGGGGDGMGCGGVWLGCGLNGSIDQNKEANIAAAKAAEGVGTFDGRSNRAQMKHLADTRGKVGDKLPCLFFHTESCKTADRPLGCSKSAEECKFHHQA